MVRKKKNPFISALNEKQANWGIKYGEKTTLKEMGKKQKPRSKRRDQMLTGGT